MKTQNFIYAQNWKDFPTKLQIPHFGTAFLLGLRTRVERYHSSDVQNDLTKDWPSSVAGIISSDLNEISVGLSSGFGV